jgi:hypothetical protein
MPRKKTPVHIYAVFIDYTDERSVMPYLGSSERLAAWHFYKAVRSAEADPLAYMVTMHKDAKPIARVHIEKL